MTMILQEVRSFDQAQCVVEATNPDSEGKPKDLYMKGIFLQGGVKNGNQRVYPVNEIRRAVDTLNENIRQGFSVCGEADHPTGMQINLDRISHMITEMYMDGNNGMGKLKILPTPMGNIVKALLENGVKLGVSSRGEGEIGYDGSVSNFRIVTVDIVMTPSAPNAFPVSMYEALQWKNRGNVVNDLAQSAMYDNRASDYLTNELTDFIKNIKL